MRSSAKNSSSAPHAGQGRRRAREGLERHDDVTLGEARQVHEPAELPAGEQGHGPPRAVLERAGVVHVEPSTSLGVSGRDRAGSGASPRPPRRGDQPRSACRERVHRARRASGGRAAPRGAGAPMSEPFETEPQAMTASRRSLAKASVRRASLRRTRAESRDRRSAAGGGGGSAGRGERGAASPGVEPGRGCRRSTRRPGAGGGEAPASGEDMLAQRPRRRSGRTRGPGPTKAWSRPRSGPVAERAALTRRAQGAGSAPAAMPPRGGPGGERDGAARRVGRLGARTTSMQTSRS